ncbi:N-acetylated-alpha-linked acidic dipeptidase protein [Dioscorea alata]|uniref:N-acetylated-alpha-linked acidic dipeptidase protein n=1 Tax=Dioscorea alata TaxID=55571 RepID=A0ACB7UMD8_DIOAL|nr:N-acetylated-alpha-linked acidic dipeptidase protein [Dioscorea alata]
MASFLTSKRFKSHVFPSVFLLVSFLLLLFYTLQRISSPSHSDPLRSRNAPASEAEAHRRFLSLSSGANSTISGHLRELTRNPHLAGTPSASTVAAYVLSQFRLAGLKTLTRDYLPLLSYPAAASLSLFSARGDLIKTFPLSEPADPESRTVPPYHAYSPSGSTLAPAVYVGYGREEEYGELDRMGVSVKGCVAVVRSGRGYRGAAVERAARKGATAVLMFGAGGGGGVQRGMVMLRGVGDPLTPGWAAESGDGEVERLGFEDEEVRRRFPTIPSMPVAVETAAEILRTLGGPSVPHEWKEGLELGGVGPGPTLVNFTYQEDRRLATIQNVFGVIMGHEEPDRLVILGNHRDAWTYGAVDPNSGTATMLDVARRFGILMRSGWRPRRTIVLCSWDAEEFGMIGSTEWVEQNLGNLGFKAVAYLNVDCAVQGPGFFAGATPQIDDLLSEVTKQIKDPDLEHKSLYETWVAENGGISIERLARADSDFSAFLHHAGVSSVDMYFGKESPVYHTSLDSFIWMEKHGDPLFHRHVALAEVWGLLALRLADDAVLPFNYLSYAAQVQDHTSALGAWLDDGISLQAINRSLLQLTAAAKAVQYAAEKLSKGKTDKDGLGELHRRAFNDRLVLAERGFLEEQGLKSRRWFKHVLYSPPEDYESKFSFFPGIADALSRCKKSSGIDATKEVQHEVWRAARAIQRVASVLRGDIPWSS